jgi:hypothetical protein
VWRILPFDEELMQISNSVVICVHHLLVGHAIMAFSPFANCCLVCMSVGAHD